MNKNSNIYGENFDIKYHPIGTIRSPFKHLSEMPIQPSGAKGVRGRIIVDKEYEEALSDLYGFSHIMLLYHFHKSKKFNPKVKPFLDDVERGLFATRAPARPNPMGISIVKILEIDKNVLQIENVDILDGTPLFDIKPYVPLFDVVEEEVRIGWLEKKADRIEKVRADDRFADADK